MDERREKFIVIMVTESCPAGKNETKEKMEDSNWHQVHSDANGHPVFFYDRQKADDFAFDAPSPQNGIKYAYVRPAGHEMRVWHYKDKYSQ